jgi:hypothetical protein
MKRFPQSGQISPRAGEQAIGICWRCFLQFYQLGNGFDGRKEAPILLWRDLYAIGGAGRFLRWQRICQEDARA